MLSLLPRMILTPYATTASTARITTGRQTLPRTRLLSRRLSLALIQTPLRRPTSVHSNLGGGGKVVYANLDSQPVEVRLASLPWSHSATTTSPSATLSLVMQVDGDSAGCRIRVDGLVRDEHFVNHQSAAVACTVTAA